MATVPGNRSVVPRPGAHGDTSAVAVAVCEFGWGSIGKLRLVLDALPDGTPLIPYRFTGVAEDLLGLDRSRHRISDADVSEARVALVINDPPMADELAALGVPVIYVDSLPYLWTSESEVPRPESTVVYCAQKFPRGRLQPFPVLAQRSDLTWIDPIVPAGRRRTGGEGVVVNIGGVHSHVAQDDLAAYESLVLPPTLDALVRMGMPILAVCGHVSDEMSAALHRILGQDTPVGRQSPKEFESLLRRADLLVSSPGSTTLLQAMVIGLPTVLLPPQNLSQILNARIFSRSDSEPMRWPTDVLCEDSIDAMRHEGEEVVVRHIYASLAAAAQNGEASARVASVIRCSLESIPKSGDLRDSIGDLGSRGADAVARLIRQACFAPHRAED